MDDLPILTSVTSAQRRGIGAPVRIVVRVCGVGGLQQGPSNLGAQRLRLAALSREQQFETLLIEDQDLLERATLALDCGERVVAQGSFCTEGEPRTGKALYFALESLAPLTRHSDLLEATPEETAEARATIARERQRPDGIYQYVVTLLYGLVGLATDSLTQRFLLAQRLTVLQALSGGSLEQNGANERISTYFVSGPGRSKKPLALFAEALSLVCAKADPGLVSLAGMAARIQQRPRQGFVAEPGALPRSSLGTCIIEDNHRMPVSSRDALCAPLMTTTEDGRVTATKAGHAVYESRCALHLNGNLRSAVGWEDIPESKAGRAQALGLPGDLLSRLCVVLCMDTDEDPIDLGRDIAAGRAQPQLPLADARAATRKLKVLVATLLDDCGEVDLAPVSAELEQATADLGAILREATARRDGGDLFHPDHLVVRMGGHIRRVAAAEARLQGRAVATAADVEVAFRMLSAKVEIVRWLWGDTDEIRPLMSRRFMVDRAARLRALRLDAILERFGGRAATAKEIAESLGVRELLIRRELELHRVPRGAHGSYDIPTLLAYVEGHRAQAEQAQYVSGPAAPRPPAEAAAEVQRALQRVEAEGEQALAEGRARPLEQGAVPLPRLLEAQRAVAQERLDAQEAEERAQRGAEGEREAGAYERPLPEARTARAEVGDGLPLLPQGARYWARTLVPEHEVFLRKMGEELVGVALEQHRPGRLPSIYAFSDLLREEFREGSRQQRSEVLLRLCDPDWARRGLFALALYAESRLPDVTDYIALELKLGLEDTLPRPLVRGLRAVIARRRQRDADEARAQAALEAAPAPR